MYKKTNTIPTQKPYYAPIIPTLTTATARTYMHSHYAHIPQQQLLYTDTDSIIHLGNTPKNIPQGTNLGQFKTEGTKQLCIINGPKTYLYGNQIKIAGVHHNKTTPTQYKLGTITHTQMNTIKTSTHLNQIGTFTTQQRHIKDITEKYLTDQEHKQQQKLYIDYNIDTTEPFLPYIQEIETLIN